MYTANPLEPEDASRTGYAEAKWDPTMVTGVNEGCKPHRLR